MREDELTARCCLRKINYQEPACQPIRSDNDRWRRIRCFTRLTRLRHQDNRSLCKCVSTVHVQRQLFFEAKERLNYLIVKK